MRNLEKWIEVHAPVGRVFDLFSRFENFPRWLPNVKEVRLIDERRTVWIVDAPPTSTALLEAKTVSFEPNERIVWSFVRGHAKARAEVTFEETMRGSTLMRVIVEEDPADNRSNMGGAGLLDEHTEQQLEESLERFKHIAEREDEDATLIAKRDGKDERLDAQILSEGSLAARAASSEPLPRPATSINSSRSTVSPVASDLRTRELPAPSVAQEAAPLRRAPLSRHRPRLVYAGLAIALALALGAWLFLAMRGRQRAEESDESARKEIAAARSPEAQVSEPEAPTPTGSVEESNPPVEVSESDAGEQSNGGNTGELRGGEQADERAQLRAGLDGWVAATNARDIDKQIDFYAPRVGRYYLRKNFSRAAVRADKTRLAARASLIDVRVGEPEVTLDRDGRTAVMSFRKEYEIENTRRGGQNKRLDRGEVMQELKWAKTKDGWKIISERDVRVLR